VVIVASSCGPTAICLKTGKSTESRSFEEVSWTSHLRTRCEPLYRHASYVASIVFSKLEHFIIVELCCNSRIYLITHFYLDYVYVIYYFIIITSIMMLCDDSGETNRPCLRT
jgi:hypothetical protein